MAKHVIIKSGKKWESFHEMFEWAREQHTYHFTGLMLDFTETMHQLLVKRGMKRWQLARRAKVPTKRVQNIFAHGPKITVEDLLRLAMALDKSITVTFFDKKDSRRPRRS